MGVWAEWNRWSGLNRSLDPPTPRSAVNNEIVGTLLAIAGALLTWTASVAGIMIWLNARFTANERLVFKENFKTRELLGRVLNQHAGRIMRLEVKTFGSTLAGRFTEDGYEKDYDYYQNDGNDGN